MSLTVNDFKYTIFGNKSVVLADIAFDSSYPTGGESLDWATLFGLIDLDTCMISPASGYAFEYDYANKKVRAFKQAPPIVYEEKHTVSSDVVTLDYPAAFIVNVAISGQNKALRSTGIAVSTLSDNQCSLVSQMAAGERTQITVKDWDRLAGDGAFTGATTNWTFSAGEADWTYGTNNVAKDQDGVETLTHDNFAPVAGRTYRLTYTISSWTAGTVTPSIGSTDGTAVGADGTYTEEITATDTDGLVFTPSEDARFTLDSVTVYDLSEPVYVTYVTQAWKDVWDNLVQDEVVTLSSAGAVDLTYPVLALMYFDQTEATAVGLTPIDEDDTAASNEVAVYFNQAEDQVKASHADNNGKDCKVTYIKNPGSGFLSDRAFDNEGATKAGSDPYTNTFDYPVLLWGYAGCMPVNGGTTLRLIDYAGTPATGEFVLDWFNPGTRGAAAPATATVAGLKDNVTGTGAGVWGVIDEIDTVPLEVKDGTNLSSLSSVKLILIGT